MSAIDTPDYQRGIVNAQQLLARVSSADLNVTVSIPPNAETLVVVLQSPDYTTRPSCVGTSSSTEYPGKLLNPPPGVGGTTSTWLFDVSNAMDAEISIQLSALSVGTWFVYTDGGIHTVADISNFNTTYGVQYVTAVAPSNRANDRPPVEIKSQAYNQTNATTVIASPGANQRIRILYATLYPETAGATDYLFGNVSGKEIIGIWGGATITAPVAVDFKPTGLALAANDGIGLSCSAGYASGHVVYTTEYV